MAAPSNCDSFGGWLAHAPHASGTAAPTSKYAILLNTNDISRSKSIRTSRRCRAGDFLCDKPIIEANDELYAEHPEPDERAGSPAGHRHAVGRAHRIPFAQAESAGGDETGRGDPGREDADSPLLDLLQSDRAGPLRRLLRSLARPGFGLHRRATQRPDRPRSYGPL